MARKLLARERGDEPLKFDPPLDFKGGLDKDGLSSRETKYGPSKIIYGANGKGTGEIISLRTPQLHRGKGHARRAMTKFIEEADKEGLDLKLGASPLDKRTHLGKLVKFYKTFGFDLTGRTINMAGDPEMVRLGKKDHTLDWRPTEAIPEDYHSFGK